MKNVPFARESDLVIQIGYLERIVVADITVKAAYLADSVEKPQGTATKKTSYSLDCRSEFGLQTAKRLGADAQEQTETVGKNIAVDCEVSHVSMNVVDNLAMLLSCSPCSKYFQPVLEPS